MKSTGNKEEFRSPGRRDKESALRALFHDQHTDHELAACSYVYENYAYYI